MKKVYIVHRWGESPSSDWYQWVKEELEKTGAEGNIPSMPNPNKPEIDAWVRTLTELIPYPTSSTILVGHSIGTQAILRYLETLPEDAEFGAVISVAGWFNLNNLETEEDKEIARPWLETPINLAKAKKHARKFVSIFSDNDPYVPLSDKDIFQSELEAEVIVQPAKGHFTKEDGFETFPLLLEQLISHHHNNTRG